VKLILTDYCMPDMIGYDLLMEVKVEFFHKLKKTFCFHCATYSFIDICYVEFCT